MTTTRNPEIASPPRDSEQAGVETVYGVAAAYLHARALHTVAEALDATPARSGLP